jgi:integral membrane sensor domain MASE1
MHPGGTQVSMRAVIGGMFLLWFGYFLVEARDDGKPMWVLAGCLGLLMLSAAALASMFRKTRADRTQRGLRRWLLETLRLTGTLVIVLLALFVMVRGYDLMAR